MNIIYHCKRYRLLKVNISYPFCVYANVCVSTEAGRVKKNVALSHRATLLLGILRRHFTNRVLPACLIYRNPEGEASCRVHLSRSARRNYAAMTSRTAERLLNSIKATLFPTRIVNLSFITSERLRYTRVPV